jgi:hypothetical protein
LDETHLFGSFGSSFFFVLYRSGERNNFPLPVICCQIVSIFERLFFLARPQKKKKIGKSEIRDHALLIILNLLPDVDSKFRAAYDGRNLPG